MVDDFSCSKSHSAWNYRRLDTRRIPSTELFTFYFCDHVLGKIIMRIFFISMVKNLLSTEWPSLELHLLNPIRQSYNCLRQQRVQLNRSWLMTESVDLINLRTDQNWLTITTCWFRGKITQVPLEHFWNRGALRLRTQISEDWKAIGIVLVFYESNIYNQFASLNFFLADSKRSILI